MNDLNEIEMKRELRRRKIIENSEKRLRKILNSTATDTLNTTSDTTNDSILLESTLEKEKKMYSPLLLNQNLQAENELNMCPRLTSDEVQIRHDKHLFEPTSPTSQYLKTIHENPFEELQPPQYNSFELTEHRKVICVLLALFNSLLARHFIFFSQVFSVLFLILELIFTFHKFGSNSNNVQEFSQNKIISLLLLCGFTKTKHLALLITAIEDYSVFLFVVFMLHWSI